jgi:PAS domain S-box-containing protein
MGATFRRALPSRHASPSNVPAVNDRLGDSIRSRVLRSPAAWHPLTMFVVLFALYWLLATSAYELFGALTLGVTFFPPAGLTFAAFYALPRRFWIPIAVAIVAGEVTVDLGQGQGIWWSLGWAAANLVEPFVGAMVARRLGGRLELSRRSAAAIVVGGLVVGPAFGAAIGATTLAVANDLGWLSSFADIWVGDSLGVLVVAPAVLLFGLQHSWPPLRWRENLDVAALTALLALTCVLFWTSEEPAVAYIAIPLLAWCALRTGPRGLALAAIAIATASTSATAHGHGPWQNIAGGDLHDQLGHEQFFLLVAVGGAWLLALEVRERAKAVATLSTIASDAALLRRALQAGGMGVWQWTTQTGRISWDEDQERLYGLAPGTFAGTIDAWSQLVHPEDRDRVFSQMRATMRSREVFRAEHRCVWPDGSVHHIEGIGEIAVDPKGKVIGAFGVAADIDHRKRAEDQRNRALVLERSARRRADLRAQVNEAIGFTLDLDELAERIVRAAVPALGDWCVLVLTLDQPREQPITATAHADPAMVAWANEYRRRFRHDPDSPNRAARVIRTGETVFAPHIDDARIAAAFEDDEQRATVRALDLRSSILVALPSPLGVLGALELIRTGSSPPYTPEDVALVEELARIIGAALNSALLHRRQLRAQRALDTLQRVTGSLTTAATVDEIVRAVLTHGAQGVAADSAMLYLLDDQRQLVLAGTMGMGAIDVTPWQTVSLAGESPVADAMHTRKVVVLTDLDDMRRRYPTTRPPDADEGAVIALPLAVRHEDVGAIVFTFRRARRFQDEELAMLDTLAGRCAGAIARARLYEAQRTASLTLQRRLLPELPATPPWLGVGARYEPASGGEVGGDWYQVLVLDDGRCIAALGDAVGRGIAAAAAMGQLRAAIAGAAAVDAHPSAVVAATSRVAASGADTRCASLAYGLIDPIAGTLTYALAGHPPPVLIRAGGDVELLDDGRGPLLGTASSTSRFGFAVTEFRAGDLLVLYTDGLVERRGESIDDGIARLARHAQELAGLPAAAMATSLVDAVLLDGETDDDIAVLVMRYARP